MQTVATRRSLLKTAGIAGAVAVAASCTSVAQAYEVAPWMPESWDCEADAVVIGFGAAGAVAAIELAEQGCTTVLLEKMSREFAGGDCSVCGGYIAAAVSEDAYVVSTLNALDRDYIDAILPYVNESASYLVDKGVELDTESFPGFALAVSKDGEPLGQALYNSLTAVVEARADKITVMYETPGIGLIQDPVTGEVLGVKAGSEGAPVYIKAARGVVVTTGGYEADREMTNAIHVPGLLFPTIGSPANTGDGVKMLMKAGCKVQNFGECLEYAAMASKAASEQAGTGITIPVRAAADNYLFVNCAGQRFMDETASLQHTKRDDVLTYNWFEGGLGSKYDNTRYPNAPAFLVFDDALMSAGPVADVDGAGMGWNIHGLYTWSSDNSAELESGWIVKADTLEELAEAVSATDMWGNEVHINPAGLVEQVEQFNASAQAGADDQFGRTALAPLGEGPYYAMEIIPATLYPTGGASHDVHAQAVDWADRPIARLYLAGQVGDPYTVHSAAVVGATAWGRIAAEQISQTEPWA